ncbi:MAG: nitrous oxide reductase accessory protein NosL [Bacteroidia bacterium]|nr:nitrous oxide reductase accessory protein NosL [Bacteroidia bacterium]
MSTHNTTTSGLTGLSKLFLLLSCIFLITSLFTPIWQIDLDAPQYPEGLSLKIFAKGLGGNVDIINGLNHYIGMKTLHNEDFIEFTILPYLITLFAIACLLVIIFARKKGLYILLGAFVVFGIVAMVDFWKWEYDYGHNLDPNAAIIVPGMAYQPPLIGFKQLLNFGAYSVPDVGGWLFIGAGVLMLVGTVNEGLFTRKGQKIKTPGAIACIIMLSLSSCSDAGISPIKLNTDHCDYCKMTIANNQFASELVTEKGRAYKFDDLSCLLNYRSEKSHKQCVCYVNDFLSPNKLLKVDSVFFIHGDNVQSPMGGNIAAFSNADSAKAFATRLNAMPVSWEKLSE